MSWLTYKDDDLKGHDIMTLHFINNEKSLLLHDCTAGEPRPWEAAGTALGARGKQTDKEIFVENKQTNYSKTRDRRIHLSHSI